MTDEMRKLIWNQVMPRARAREVINYIDDLEARLRAKRTECDQVRRKLDQAESDEGWRRSAEHSARTGGTL